MPFKKGHKLAKGGARPGSGRKSEDFHSQIDAGLSDGKVIKTIIDMAKGVNGLWSEKIRFSAATWLLEMKNGKAAQGVQVTGQGGGPVQWTINVSGVGLA